MKEKTKEEIMNKELHKKILKDEKQVSFWVGWVWGIILTCLFFAFWRFVGR